MGTYANLFQKKPQPKPVETDVVSRPASPVPENSDAERKSERTEIRTEKRSESELATLPIKRRTKRYSFEFYDDQIVKLKQLKRQAEDRGESLTLSDIARTALDRYLNA